MKMKFLLSLVSPSSEREKKEEEEEERNNKCTCARVVFKKIRVSFFCFPPNKKTQQTGREHFRAFKKSKTSVERERAAQQTTTNNITKEEVNLIRRRRIHQRRYQRRRR
jgi:carbohydrate-binding DOMON domain-containing protein